MASNPHGVKNTRAGFLFLLQTFNIPFSAPTGGEQRGDCEQLGSRGSLLPSDSPLGRGGDNPSCLCFLFAKTGIIISAASLALNGDFEMSHVLNMYVKFIQ